MDHVEGQYSPKKRERVLFLGTVVTLGNVLSMLVTVTTAFAVVTGFAMTYEHRMTSVELAQLADHRLIIAISRKVGIETDE